MFNLQRTPTLTDNSVENNKLASTWAYEGSRQDVSSTLPRHLTSVSKPPVQFAATMVEKTSQEQVQNEEKERSEILVVMGQQMYRIDVTTQECLLGGVQDLIERDKIDTRKGLALKIIILDKIVSRRPELEGALENAVSEYQDQRIRQLQAI